MSLAKLYLSKIVNQVSNHAVTPVVYDDLIGDGFSSKLYTYAVAKEESYPEKSYGNHQATSYMQDASKIRSAKAKLDFDSVDMASLESR